MSINQNDYITITLDSVDTMASSAVHSSGTNIGSISITDNTASSYNYNYNWNTTAPITVTGIDNGITLTDWANTSQNLHVNGDANFEGDVKIKGKSIVESLEKIEEKLAILRPNEKLEEKWDQLRELRKQYMDLEKEIIQKEKMWDILKK